MKHLILMAFAILLMSYNAQAQHFELISSPNGIGGTVNDFKVCGVESRTFQVIYDHCPNSKVNCLQGCGANPVRVNIRLYRDNTLLQTLVFQTSNDWFNQPIVVANTSPGAYKVEVTVQRRKFSCLSWETVFNQTSNIITALGNASPAFNIDGIAIPSNNSAIQVCGSNISLNAAATSCETRHYIGVQECNQWWSRTYEYEWGRWYTGQANDNINLQALSTWNSNDPLYFSGTDVSRMGDALFGGYLSSGQERYYRVSVCTGEPSWQCKVALIKVNGNCKLAPSDLQIETLDEYTTTGSSANDNNELELAIDPNNTIASSSALTTIRISPNPFNATTIISVDSYTEKAPIVFELYNLLGERVESIQSNQNQFELNRNQLAAGVYTYRATADNQLLGSGKIVIQ